MEYTYRNAASPCLMRTSLKKTPPAVADQIKNALVEKFADNLSAVLLYGSSQWGNEYWDLDIMIILKQNDFKLTDLNLLRNAVEEFSDQSLDLQVLYLSEIKSPDTFSLDAHGAFFSRILSRAVELYGENPFKSDSFVPKKEVLLISLLTRIQRYVFHARQEYILSGRYNKDKNPKYHQKHVIRAMFDVLLMSREWLETEEVIKLFAEQFPNTLDAADWEALGSGADEVQNYMVLYEKVYAEATKEIERLTL
jgi:hypothetical protein